MMRLNREQRATQLAAFEMALGELHPESVLRRQMVAARHRKGWTQAELARRMGTTQSAIARLEAGGISPTFAALKKLARVTGSRLVVRLEEDGCEG